MQSKATTVEQYLKELPADRRAAISAVRDVIRKNIDKAYEEGMLYGMIGYSVPHSLYPAGYHCDPTQPLGFCCLASQKNYMSLYMMTCYGEGPEQNWFKEAWVKTGKKLDMGKSCIRFKQLDYLPLDLIGEAIRRVPVKKCIEFYEKAREMVANRPEKGPPKKGAKKPIAENSVTKTKAVKKSARSR